MSGWKGKVKGIGLIKEFELSKDHLAFLLF